MWLTVLPHIHLQNLLQELEQKLENLKPRVKSQKKGKKMVIKEVEDSDDEEERKYKDRNKGAYGRQIYMNLVYFLLSIFLMYIHYILIWKPKLALLYSNQMDWHGLKQLELFVSFMFSHLPLENSLTL